MSWKLVDDLDDVEATFRAEMRDAVHNVTKHVFDKSQDVVPVDSGDLKRSGKLLSAGQTSLPGSPGVDAEEIVYEEDYGLFVETGYFNIHSGRYVAGRRFLSKPLRDAEGRLEQAGLNAMDRAFRKAKS